MICPVTASMVLAWAAAGLVYSSLQMEGWSDETHPGSFYSLSRLNLVFRNLYTLSAGLHLAMAFYASFSSPLLLSAFFSLSLLSLVLPSSSLSLLSLFFLLLLLSLSFFLNSLSQRFPFNVRKSIIARVRSVLNFRSTSIFFKVVSVGKEEAEEEESERFFNAFKKIIL